MWIFDEPMMKMRRITLDEQSVRGIKVGFEHRINRDFFSITLRFGLG